MIATPTVRAIDAGSSHPSNGRPLARPPLAYGQPIRPLFSGVMDRPQFQCSGDQDMSASTGPELPELAAHNPLIIVSNGGTRTTMKIVGRIRNTSGTSILTGVF